MMVVIWKGWGLALMLITGIIPMIACYSIYGHTHIDVLEKENPVFYWRLGMLGGAIVAVAGFFLNRFRRTKEERRFNNARHSFIGIPVEYMGLFWLLVSLANSSG